MRKQLRVLMAGFIGVLMSASALAVDWTIENLPPAAASTEAISNRGWVTGVTAPPDRAFVWNGSSMSTLGTLGGSTSHGRDINVSGWVVGYSTNTNNTWRAFLFDGLSMYDLGTLPSARPEGISAAWGINASGQIVGDSEASTTFPWPRHAFLHTGIAMVDLGTLGGTHSGAIRINPRGQVVGSSNIAGDVAYHAFLYTGTAMVDLGTLGGTYSDGRGINVNGEVVGFSDTVGGTRHAFLYTGTAMLDLGTLGGTISGATGINSSGQVVGFSYMPGDVTYHGFLFDGAMRDLSMLPEVVAAGWVLNTADAINDSGQIVGMGSRGAYRLHPQSMSRYMKTVNPAALYNLGCSQTNQNGVVILDFGRPRYNGIAYGTTLFQGSTAFTSISAIEAAVKAFMDGYYQCPGNGATTVAVGTSNDGPEVTAAHGRAWGDMIVRLNAYIDGPPSLRGRLSVVGASDIELMFNSPAISRAWVDGYRSASPTIGFYNYGDAQGCPPAGTSCSAGWTQQDIWYVSWGNSPSGDGRSFPVPEIYFNVPPLPPTNARQWARIATLYSGSPMYIPAALTSWQACVDKPPCNPNSWNTPVLGWQQLMDALYGVAADPTLVQDALYSSDITWQN